MPDVEFERRLEESRLRTIRLSSSKTEGFRIVYRWIKGLIERLSGEECYFRCAEICSFMPGRLSGLQGP